jgi:hypothetical protein
MTGWTSANPRVNDPWNDSGQSGDQPDSSEQTRTHRSRLAVRYSYLLLVHNVGRTGPLSEHKGNGKNDK